MIVEKIINHLIIKKVYSSDFEQILTNTLEDNNYDKIEIKSIINQIYNREKLISFYTGNYSIIPRATIDTENTFEIYFIVSSNDIKYQDYKVKIIVLFIYSSDNYKVYIEALPFFIRILLNRMSIDNLIQNSEDELENLIIKGLRDIEN